MRNNNKTIFSLICVIFGTILLVIFAGKFLIPIIGAVLGIFLINYGLEQLGLPKIHHIIFHFIKQILHMFRR